MIKNYNKNIHWLKMLKEHELSAVALQPSTDKNGIQDEYNIYINWKFTAMIIYHFHSL